jgi:MFS family permease
MRDSQAAGEWRAYWTLPLAAAVGFSTATLHVYSLGTFMRPLQAAFGWGRAEVSSGIFVAGLAGALLHVLVGMLVDRVGPRKVAILGISSATAAFALLGTATGTHANWLCLWLVVAFASCFITPTVWASAVSTRFDKSRGLALGIMLSGGALGATSFPLIGTILITHYGWRMAFAGLGALWAVLVLPVVLIFFRGANDGAERKAREAAAGTTGEPVAGALPGLTVREALRASALYKLMIVAGLYPLFMVGLIVHLVPILEDRGMSPIEAATKAGLVGIFAVVGRLSTGVLLDRMRSNVVGGLSFLLPIIACGLLLAPATGTVGQVIATSIVGLSTGGEFSVVTYLATRHFGMRRFGVLYGAVTIPMAFGTASGPLVAGAIFDHLGSYTVFIELAILLSLACGAVLYLLGTPPVWVQDNAEAHQLPNRAGPAVPEVAVGT